ncbi:MAG: hypothetical protein K2H43_00095, partial [Clostridia bacterium]|nr:hypothetical protein [Clostridia bacterium]
GVEDETNLSYEFEILKKNVEFTWNGTEFTYNGKEQAPEAKINEGFVCTDAEGNADDVKILVHGAVDVGSDYTATVYGISNENYSLEGIAEENLSTKFSIVPAVVELEWGDTTLTYNGKEQLPEVKIKESSLFSKDGENLDECLISEIEGAARDVGAEYEAKVIKLSNSNYALPETVTKQFEIVALKVVVDWGEMQVEYNGEVRHPSFTFNRQSNEGVEDDMDLTFTFENEGDGIDVGTYTATVALSGSDAGNYELDEKDRSVTFEIVPKEITVYVKTLDIEREFTGSAITVTDSEWYELTTDGIVERDAEQGIGGLFDLSGLALEPIFKDKSGNTVDSVVERGEYRIVPVKYP